MTTPIRTSKADSNYLSINRDTVVWFAGTAEQHQGSIPMDGKLLPAEPQAWDAVLKFSGRHNLQLGGLRVAQGRENAVDLNNECNGIALEGVFGVGGGEGDQVFTVKGGTIDTLLKGTVESRGRKAIAVLGCWSDQSTKPTSYVDMSMLRMKDASVPFTVILGRVNRPLRSILFGRSPDIALPPGAVILKWDSIKELAYWWAKRVYVLARYQRW